jgi:hypothetical protein
VSEAETALALKKRLARGSYQTLNGHSQSNGWGVVGAVDGVDGVDGVADG